MEYNPNLQKRPFALAFDQGNHKTEESCAVMDQNGDQPQKMKNNRGKRKIRIEPILNKSKKQVTFTKRRGGLFKKAGDFCRRSGSQVAIVTFSCAGKLYPFGYPNADQVINRYLGSQESGRNQSCGFWWEDPIDGLGLDQLEEFKTELMGLRNHIASKLSHITSSNTNHPAPQAYTMPSNSFGSAVQQVSLASADFGSAPQASGLALEDFGSCFAHQCDVSSQGSGFTSTNQSDLCPQGYSFTSMDQSDDLCLQGSGFTSMDQSDDLCLQGSGFTSMDQGDLYPQVTGFTSTDQSDHCPQGSGFTSMDQSDDFWLDMLKSCYY